MKTMRFSPDMLNAVLLNKKTQTRRPIKTLPLFFDNPEHSSILEIGYGHPIQVDEGGEEYPGEMQFMVWTSDWSAPVPYEPNMIVQLNGCRIRIKEVRIERLHDISHEDVLAEGAESVEAFGRLWDTFYPNSRYSWENNPYVFVYLFEKDII